MNGYDRGFGEILSCHRIQDYKNLVITCNCRGVSLVDLRLEFATQTFGRFIPRIITEFDFLSGSSGVVVLSFESLVESNISLTLLRREKVKIFRQPIVADFLREEPLKDFFDDENA